jgi:hypothetical protein
VLREVVGALLEAAEMLMPSKRSLHAPVGLVH